MTKDIAFRAAFLVAVAAGIGLGDVGGPVREPASAMLAAERAGNPGSALSRAALQPRIVAAYGQLPLAFEANGGQTDPRVQFLSRGRGYILFLTPTGAVLSLRAAGLTGRASDNAKAPAKWIRAGRHPKQPSERQQSWPARRASMTLMTLETRLVEANPSPRVTSQEKLPGRVNYFIGNDPKNWRTNVPTYARVRYEDVYPGVDLVYYGNQQHLEYDFIVAPGADPKRIELVFHGATRLALDRDANLVLETAAGEVRFHKPVAYQQVGGARREVAASYVLEARSRVRFKLGAYDATQPLVIDPVLSYSTYLGGSAQDQANGIAVDPSSGNAFIVGSTGSSDFPAKNALQSAFGGSTDAFVTELNSTGSAVVYSTFLGGKGQDSGKGIALDSTGNAYLVGRTESSDFPTKNAFQSVFGGVIDAFAAKLDATGALVYSTFLGGNGDDEGLAVAVDGSGNAYAAGTTGSAAFPTKNAFQSKPGGNLDAFVAKFDSAGALVYSTFLGGSGQDQANGIAVDSLGNAYVTGSTGSTNFPTASPLQATCGGCSSGLTDGFVAKLNATGSALVYSTYLGGSRTDLGTAIAVDAAESAYVTGETESTNFPTASPLQAACGGCGSGFSNAFVTKLNAAGSALVYSTYLGGSGNGASGDGGFGIVVDPVARNAYVTGIAASPDFPLASPVQASLVAQTCFVGGYYGPYEEPCGNTAFVTELNAAGSALVYSTFVGASGGNFEAGNGIALDSAGDAYIVGFSPSGNFPLTPGAFQLVPGGQGDGFAAKIDPSDAAGFSLTSFNLTFPDEGIGGTTAAETITVADSGSAPLAISSVTPTGDFAIQSNTCGAGLTGGASCTISITFTPTASGARAGAITFTDNAASSPQTATLGGNGIAGLAATLSPSSLNFNGQTVDILSAAQTVTLTNTGSATLTLNGVSLSGTNPSDFIIRSSSCSGSLVVNTSCTVGVAFSPQVLGNLSATLEILDNSAQSPRMVPLAGVGIAPPTVTLSPTTLSFAGQVVGSTSPPQPLTLTTTGSGTLVISSISASGDFGVSNETCGSSVIGGAACTISVTFTPSAVGNRTGTLVVADNATDSPQMVSLSGVGTSISISPAPGSPSSATVAAGQSATYTVSVAGTAGFVSGTVSLRCGSSAPQSSCSVSPNSLALSGTTPMNAMVTVTTASRSAAPPRWPTPPLSPGLRIALPWMLFLLSLATLAGALRRRSKAPRRAWLGLAALLLTAALFFGCGGSTAPRGTPSGTYPVTVDATTAGVTSSTTLVLIVE